MKRVTKILLLALVAVMVMGLFSGCETTQQKIEKLAGTWTMTADDSEEQAQALLENIDLYEEEIAFVDLASLDYVQIVEFDTNQNYRFAYDAAATQACVRAFFESAFDALYENRAALSDIYDTEFDQMDKNAFQQFYAKLYGMDDFSKMLDEMAAGAYDYDALAEDWETGTFTISHGKIMCTITGESTAEALEYAIKGDTLTLTYADGVEVYTRSK